MSRYERFTKALGNAGIVIWPIIIAGAYCFLLSDWVATSIRQTEEDNYREASQERILEAQEHVYRLVREKDGLEAEQALRKRVESPSWQPRDLQPMELVSLRNPIAP